MEYPAIPSLFGVLFGDSFHEQLLPVYNLKFKLWIIRDMLCEKELIKFNCSPISVILKCLCMQHYYSDCTLSKTVAKKILYKYYAFFKFICAKRYNLLILLPKQIPEFASSFIDMYSLYCEMLIEMLHLKRITRLNSAVSNILSLWNINNPDDDKSNYIYFATKHLKKNLHLYTTTDDNGGGLLLENWIPCLDNISYDVPSLQTNKWPFSKTVFVEGVSGTNKAGYCKRMKEICIPLAMTNLYKHIPNVRNKYCDFISSLTYASSSTITLCSYFLDPSINRNICKFYCHRSLFGDILYDILLLNGMCSAPVCECGHKFMIPLLQVCKEKNIHKLNTQIRLFKSVENGMKILKHRALQGGIEVHLFGLLSDDKLLRYIHIQNEMFKQAANYLQIPCIQECWVMEPLSAEELSLWKQIH